MASISIAPTFPRSISVPTFPLGQKAPKAPEPMLITRAHWDGLPRGDKKTHKDKTHWVRVRASKGGKDRWVQVIWKS